MTTHEAWQPCTIVLRPTEFDVHSHHQMAMAATAADLADKEIAKTMARIQREERQ